MPLNSCRKGSVSCRVTYTTSSSRGQQQQQVCLTVWGAMWNNLASSCWHCWGSRPVWVASAHNTLHTIMQPAAYTARQ